MTPHDLIAAFHTLAEAPEGVARLRELVLQLAVRGKLVPQDPADEPASVLLERIAANELIKPTEHTEAVTGADSRWELPVGWTWCRLRSIVDFSIGKTPSTKNSSFWADCDGHAWVSIADMEHYGGVAHTHRRVSERAALEIFKSSPQPAGTILMSFKLTIGKIARLLVPAFHNEAIISIFPPYPALAEYLFRVLPLFASGGNTNAAIKGMTLNKESLTNLLVALPPLPEQKRIVARVDELMGLLDRLEAARNAREATRTALRDATLAALRNADTPEEVEVAWARIVEQMDELFTTPADVAPLRQTVLQLAVRGRLVYRTLTKQVDERLVLVGDILDILNGYAFKSEWYVERGVRVVRNQNVSHGTIDWTDERQVSVAHAGEFERFALRDGDVVLSLDRPLISTGLKVARVQPQDLPCLLLQRVACLRVRSEANVLPDYLYVWLNSPCFTGSIDPGRSNGVPHISTREIERMAIRLPALAEQEHIVEKVGELMNLLDRLEKRLAAKTSAQDAFAAAAVHHLETEAQP